MVPSAKKEKYLWMCLFVKNDARNTIEWIVWHLLLGADHILLYDNNSSDNLSEALGSFVSASLVTRLPWDGIGISAQQAAYRHSINFTRHQDLVARHFGCG
jgi:cytochrome b